MTPTTMKQNLNIGLCAMLISAVGMVQEETGKNNFLNRVKKMTSATEPLVPLSGQPRTKGVYVKNGIKAIIK